MFEKIANHIRLTLHLLTDRRVSWVIKVLFIGLPLAYAVIPFLFEVPDYIPVIGLIDDVILMVLATIIFNVACPKAIVREYRGKFRGETIVQGMDLEQYRHPDELRNLGIGLVITIALLVIMGSAVGFVLLLALGIGFALSEVNRSNMLSNAIQCSPTQFPEIYESFMAAQAELPEVETLVFITQSADMNATTFGMREPYSIVLNSELVDGLTKPELKAVIGHELGHVLFDHVFLNNLANVSATGLERWILSWWSRSGEYTSDAIALHVSGNDPKPMISALLKLASGMQSNRINLDDFLAQVEASDAKQSNLRKGVEWLGTHPNINNRIRRLIALAADDAPQNVLEAEAA